MACSIKNAPPTEAAVNKLLSKVGGTLEQALNSQELRWSSKRLDADDAHVVAYVVALSTVRWVVNVLREQSEESDAAHLSCSAS